MAQPTVTVTATGPFFRSRFPPVIQTAAHNAIEDLVEMGISRLHEQLRPRPAGVYLSVQEARPGQVSQGHYRRSIQGRVQHLNAMITDGRVVYGPWLEGTSKRNQRTRFKGYAQFRQTAQWLQKQARTVFQKHVAAAVRRLNGF